MPSPPKVPLRHSLLARLLAGSVLVAMCSVTATAWLSIQGTSESISDEQGQTLAVDTRIHDTVVGYAATHPDWTGVRSTIGELAAETGRRIALTTENRGLIADSAPEGTPLPPRTSSVVDPLAVDVTFASEDADRIDPRAVGPYALDQRDRERLRAVADAGADCLRDQQGLVVEVSTAPSGRPAVEVPDAEVDPVWWDHCGLDALEEPTAGERAALDELNRLIAACTRPLDLDVRYRIDGATGRGSVLPDAQPDDARAPWQPMDLPGAPEPVPSTAPGRPEPSPPGAGNDAPAEEGGTPSSPAPGAEVPGAVPAQEEPRVSPTAGLAQPRPPSSAAPAPAEEAAPAPFQLDPRAAACVDSARREQLDPYVAPAALLFIDDPEQETTAGLMISREGIARISWVVLLVLVLTVAVSVTLSARLVRPVRALTDAVQRMRAGDGSARVEVADSGEIGRLAVAFNEMSEHLQRLEEQRKAMVSDVSHELRTPLSNLRGWLEAVQDGVADPEPERMAMLVEETLLLQRIIDDLQELALADAGRLRLSLGLVDAGELVEQSVASHRLHAETAGVELSARLSGDLTLVADRGRLLQAVGNLVGNALRHTPAGGRVTVTARGAGEAVVIEVADTGEGIAPEHLPHVFDRFWRAEKSRNRRTGGSGLGLAIVRNLAELHGGTAEVAAEPGRGAVFTLRLPRGRVPSGDGESGQG